MADLIQQYSNTYESAAGVLYSIRACGQGQADGAWEGWLEFHPVDDMRPPLRTGLETFQPTRFALARWASRLDRSDFEGAFLRVRRIAEPQKPSSAIGIRDRIA